MSSNPNPYSNSWFHSTLVSPLTIDRCANFLGKIWAIKMMWMSIHKRDVSFCIHFGNGRDVAHVSNLYYSMIRCKMHQRWGQVFRVDFFHIANPLTSGGHVFQVFLDEIEHSILKGYYCTHKSFALIVGLQAQRSKTICWLVWTEYIPMLRPI